MKIKKLNPDKYKNVRHLFREDDTNLSVSYGVLEGLIPGQIWVDDVDRPNVCLIMCEDSYCLIAGDLEENIFNEFFTLLKQKASIRLQYEPNVHYKQVNLLNLGFTLLPRREYKYKNINSIIPRFENNTKYILKPVMDEQIFNLCMWKQLMLDIYIDERNYFKNAMSFILWDDEKQLVVSEAHGICSKEFVEIATVTHENYRGQKLSTIICNHLIQHSIGRGLIPVYSCNEDNIASRKVAEHLGMDDVVKYVFYSLDK